MKLTTIQQPHELLGRPITSVARPGPAVLAELIGQTLGLPRRVGEIYIYTIVLLGKYGQSFLCRIHFQYFFGARGRVR